MNKYLFLGLLFVTAYGWSQNQANYSEQFSKLVQVPNSPEAEAFTQYGSYDVGLLTGTPNISVPLYTFKGKEMDLPISLTYDATGIKVTQVASNVGLGWNLNIGGRVSRQTRGLSDHGTVTPGPLSNSIRQKILKYRDYNGVSDDTGLIFDNSSLANAKASVQDYYEFMEDVQKSEIDIEQDYFSVNGMGLNDIIWMDTETYGPVALKNPNLKVESPLPLGTNSGFFDILYWEFLDEQGNRYYFGNYVDGDLPYNPVTNPSNPIEIIKRTDDKDTQPIPNSNITYNSSWLLSKVVSANGKDVYYFNYTNYDELDLPEIPNVINQTISHNKVHTGGGHTEYTGDGQLPGPTQISSVKTLNTVQLLESVYHNGKEIIRFEFEDRYDIQNGTNKAIKGIKIYEDYASSQTPVEEIEFETTEFGPANPSSYYERRLKLDEVKIGKGSEANKYTFDYYSPTLVPSRLSKSIDLFGYFNNEPNPTHFESLTQFNLPGADREPSENQTKIGTLKSIAYPTGGYTEFHFENHKNATEIFPGLRIQSIKNYSAQSVLETEKIYEYPNDKVSQNFTPLTHVIETPEKSPCIDDGFGIYPATIYRYIYPPNMDDDPYITYEEVIEKSMSNGVENGHTVYTFKTGNENWINFNQMPFHNYHYTTGQSIGSPTSSTIKNDAGNTLVSEINTYGNIGSIYTDKTFVVAQNPLKHFSYICVTRNGNYVSVYSGDGQADPDTSSCPTINLEFWQIESQGHESIAGRYCTGPNSLPINVHTLAKFEQRSIFITADLASMVSMQKTEHFNTLQKTTTTSNEFGSASLLLSATNVTIGNDEEERVEYTYPEDIPVGQRSQAENELISQNKVAIPLKTTTKRIDSNDDENTISVQETEYKIWNIGSEQYVLPEFFRGKKGGNSGFIEDRIKVVELDSFGNIVEAKLINGTSVSYLWGYNGKYPVAKIENASYAEATNNSLNLDFNKIDNPNSIQDIQVEIQKIRTGLPNAQVTTFTYEPLVGVNSITDPKAYTMTYHYDNQNRLQYVKDQDGNVLTENNYNLRTNN
ncbi:MAG: hypothetical protein AAF466_09155 [Bacteroidota bacterium]